MRELARGAETRKKRSYSELPTRQTNHAVGEDERTGSPRVQGVSSLRGQADEDVEVPRGTHDAEEIYIIRLLGKENERE